jgi:hypothetical protein
MLVLDLETSVDTFLVAISYAFKKLLRMHLTGNTTEMITNCLPVGGLGSLHFYSTLPK